MDLLTFERIVWVHDVEDALILSNFEVSCFVVLLVALYRGGTRGHTIADTMLSDNND